MRSLLTFRSFWTLHLQDHLVTFDIIIITFIYAHPGLPCLSPLKYTIIFDQTDVQIFLSTAYGTCVNHTSLNTWPETYAHMYLHAPVCVIHACLADC